MPTVLGMIMLALTYVGAVAMVLSVSPVVRVGGWLFLVFKGTVAATTALGVMRRPKLGWRLFLGRYLFDTAHVGHGLTQAFLRYWWELPQLWLGYMVAVWRVIIGQIDRVESLGGVTYAIDEDRHDGMEAGMSLGCFVNIWLTDSVAPDFEYHVRHHSGQIFMHEFGHTMDSLRWGWLYLLVVGIPSYLSQMLELASHGHRHQHRHLYAERWANKNAERYFRIPIRDLQS